MQEKNEKELSLDLLKHLEDMSQKINEIMAKHTKAVFERYPITFGVLIFIGATMLHDGLKGILADLGILEMKHWHLFLLGALILVFTGKLYKKLGK